MNAIRACSELPTLNPETLTTC